MVPRQSRLNYTGVTQLAVRGRPADPPSHTDHERAARRARQTVRVTEQSRQLVTPRPAECRGPITPESRPGRRTVLRFGLTLAGIAG